MANSFREKHGCYANFSNITKTEAEFSAPDFWSFVV